jgi:uncharacterized protein (DUF302 family)
MDYYFACTARLSFEAALTKVAEELKKEGFGILTEIDVAATLKKKLDVQFRPYRILGACNPRFAWQAFQAEDKIGVMLPCNFIVQELGPDRVEVAAVNPLSTMQAVNNPALKPLAGEVAASLQRVIDSLASE